MARPKEEFPTFDQAALDALIGDVRSPEDFTAVPLEIPRNCEGTVRPQLVPTGVRRLPQFAASVFSLYARGTALPRCARRDRA